MVENNRDAGSSNSSPTGVPNKSENDTNSNELLLTKIYEWASQNTSETRQLAGYKYYWTDAAKDLLNRLQLSKGQLIALVGLSGVGKSSALNQVAVKLNEHLAGCGEKNGTSHGGQVSRAVFFKWPGYLDSNYDRVREFLKDQGVEASYEEYFLEAVKRSRNIRTPDAFYHILREFFYEVSQKGFPQDSDEGVAHFLAKKAESGKCQPDLIVSKLLGPGPKKKFDIDLTISLLARCHSILLDLRDYGASSSRALGTDLEEIQNVWNSINQHLMFNKSSGISGAPPNIVFVVQRELAYSEESKFTHFFLGKAQRCDIVPLSPRQMIEAYELEFGTTYPFKEGTLMAVAVSSWGVFRRFLRFVQLCINEYLQNPQFRDPDFVVDSKFLAKAVPGEVIVEELEKRVRQAFPRGSRSDHAMKIIASLAGGSRSQKDILEDFVIYDAQGKSKLAVSDAELSRILSKLEEYGFIKRETTKFGKMVSLNLGGISESDQFVTAKV